MNKNKMALILNGFVFPGAGQVHLDHTRRGLIFIGTTLLIVIYLVIWIVQQFYQIILDMKMRGDSVLDILKLVPVIEESLYNTPAPTVKYLLITLLVIWLVAIIDIFYLIRKKAVQ